MTLNVAIVGPGRSKQGTGPFIARLFSKLACDVQAVSSSSLESAQAAANSLQREYAIRCKAYHGLDALLTQQAVDIVVISSPATTHLEYLKTAVHSGCHVFCEKPLWWTNQSVVSLTDVENISNEAIHLVRECNAQRTILQTNTQWPFTLPAYFELYPQLKEEGDIQCVSMWLAPESDDANMIVDAVPHALSMLYTLVGTGRINNVESNFHSRNSRQDVLIEFDFLHAFGNTRVSITLSPGSAFPRPAAFAINGFRADRHIELPDYLISLSSSERQIPIVDPLESSIRNFISSIYSKAASDEVALIDGMTHLAELYLAVTQPQLR